MTPEPFCYRFSTALRQCAELVSPNTFSLDHHRLAEHNERLYADTSAAGQTHIDARLRILGEHVDPDDLGEHLYQLLTGRQVVNGDVTYSGGLVKFTTLNAPRERHWGTTGLDADSLLNLVIE